MAGTSARSPAATARQHPPLDRGQRAAPLLGDTAAASRRTTSAASWDGDWIAQTFRIARRRSAGKRAVAQRDLHRDGRGEGARARPSGALAGPAGRADRRRLAPGPPVHPDAAAGRSGRRARAAHAAAADSARHWRSRFTEIDAPLPPTVPGRFEEQARRVGTLVESCLAVRRCSSITFWNLQDAESWLNGLFGRDDLAPTLFGADLRPKPVFFAVRSALLANQRQTHRN